MSSYIVAVPDEIPPGSRQLVQIDGREVAIFNLDGSFYAVRNRCPHQGGPLCAGIQVGTLSSPMPGEYELSSTGGLLQCPWHHWEFDIRTGQSWFDPQGVRARAYQTRVEAGSAVVARLADDEIAAPGTRAPGPYVAEIYPVTVEQDYIVVDIG